MTRECDDFMFTAEPSDFSLKSFSRQWIELRENAHLFTNKTVILVKYLTHFHQYGIFCMDTMQCMESNPINVCPILNYQSLNAFTRVYYTHHQLCIMRKCGGGVRILRCAVLRYACIYIDGRSVGELSIHIHPNNLVSHSLNYIQTRKICIYLTINGILLDKFSLFIRQWNGTRAECWPEWNETGKRPYKIIFIINIYI